MKCLFICTACTFSSSSWKPHSSSSAGMKTPTWTPPPQPPHRALQVPTSHPLNSLRRWQSLQITMCKLKLRILCNLQQVTKTCNWHTFPWQVNTSGKPTFKALTIISDIVIIEWKPWGTSHFSVVLAAPPDRQTFGKNKENGEKRTLV